MAFRVIIHSAAEAELETLFHHLRRVAGAERAGASLAELYDFLAKLETFPRRGMVRDSMIPELRIIGFHRRISIAFTIDGDTVLILGVFSGGRDVTIDTIEERL